ncbi:MAG: T9SS type A sorting domain-containing protein [Saprospiraceae bacterium]
MFLDFDLPTNLDFKIFIYDGFGNILLGKNASNISNQKLEFEVSDLTSGLYFVKIQTSDQIWIRKFIIQNRNDFL